MNRAPEVLRKGARRLDQLASKLERKQELAADFYDAKFTEHPEYQGHYTESVYYPIWTVIAERLRPVDRQRILELGCGPGQLAHLLADLGVQDYVGVDFSPAALAAARSRCGSFTFAERDLTMPGALADLGADYSTVIATEVLEHIQDDLAVLSLVASGARVLASVPNYSAEGHIRVFASERQVRGRYESLIRDMDVSTVRLNRRGAVLFVIDGYTR